MIPDVEPLQWTLFDLGAYDEPDTLTKAEYLRLRRADLVAAWRARRRVEVRLAEPPPTWAGRPWRDVEVTGDRL
jgi:hypothetical protein